MEELLNDYQAIQRREVRQFIEKQVFDEYYEMFGYMLDPVVYKDIISEEVQRRFDIHFEKQNEILSKLVSDIPEPSTSVPFYAMDPNMVLLTEEELKKEELFLMLDEESARISQLLEDDQKILPESIIVDEEMENMLTKFLEEHEC